MGKLIKLPNAQISNDEPLEPNEKIIAYLEKKLEEAKAGKLQAMGFVGVHGDDVCNTIYAFYIPVEDCRNSLMAGVQLLAYDLVGDARDATVETEPLEDEDGDDEEDA